MAIKLEKKMIHHFFKITADDFGYCKQRNKGIRIAFTQGLVNSVSVIVNAASIEKIDDNANLITGLHLNITEGKPLSDENLIPSIVNVEGIFHDKFTMIKLAKAGKINSNEVIIELTRQVEKFIQIYGHTPKYIDGHQHAHILPGIREPLVKVMTKYDIRNTRIPIEIGLSECLRIEKRRMEFYEDVNCMALDAKTYFDENNIRFPTYFIGLTTMSRDFTVENIRYALELIYQKVINDKQRYYNDEKWIEIMTHPGYPSCQGLGGCGQGPDEFSLSQDRRHELNVLCSGPLRRLLEGYAKRFHSLVL